FAKRVFSLTASDSVTGCLLRVAPEPHGDELRVGQNEFAQLDLHAANRERREQMRRDFLRQRLDETTRLFRRNTLDRFTNLRVIDRVLDRIAERGKIAPRLDPQRRS